MRVMLVNQHFPPQYRGGSERSVQSLARELAAMGDQVSVIARCPAARPAVPVTVRERLPDGTRLYRVRGGEFHINRFLHQDLALEQEFTRAVLEQKPDVVHIHHLRSHAPGYVEIAVKLGSAVVISLHDFYFACPLAHLQKTDGRLCQGPDAGRECAATCFSDETDALPRWRGRADYFKSVLQLGSAVICYSNYVADYFLNYGIPRSKLRVIPLGIDLPGSTPRVSKPIDAPLSLAFCGSVIRLKGPHVILQALKQARLPAVQLTLLGSTTDAKYLSELQAMASTIPGLTMNVAGPYNWSDMDDHLAGVDCVISPSMVAETFGIVPREALARGVPVMVSNLGALGEAVREGENGFTFNPVEPGQLARLLTALHDQPDLRAALRIGAKASFVESAANHAAAVRAVYEQVLARPAGPAAADAAALQRQYQELVRLNFR